MHGIRPERLFASPSPRASRPCPAATAMAAAVVYSFPLLPAAEISTCLSELGIDFSEAALSKPEPEPVAKLFEELVVSQMGVTRCGGLRRRLVFLRNRR